MHLDILNKIFTVFYVNIGLEVLSPNDQALIWWQKFKLLFEGNEIMQLRKLWLLAALPIASGCGAAYVGQPDELKPVMTYWAHRRPADEQYLLDKGIIRAEFKEAIEHKEIRPGMNEWECRASWGWAKANRSFNQQGNWTQLVFLNNSTAELLNGAVVSAEGG